MSTRPVGYSGKPLIAKLGFKDGSRVGVVSPAGHLEQLYAGWPPERYTCFETAADLTGVFDALHVFCADKAALQKAFPSVVPHLAEDAMLWLSWPKKSSPLYTDLTENDLRAAVLPTGWVDVKVCAVDADWSGLKFLRRKR